MEIFNECHKKEGTLQSPLNSSVQNYYFSHK